MKQEKIQLSGCVIIKDEKILLLLKKKHNHYELPGGKLEEGETLKWAALRETNEEIGCEVRLIKYIGYKEFYINEKDYQSHNFLAEIIGDQTPVVEEKEIFENILWMPIKDYKKYNVASNVKELCADYLAGKIIL
jgi:ADP-ribose pyrophosphatase YjhB (NUDIX family)